MYVVGSYYEIRALDINGRPILAFIDSVDGNIVQIRDRPEHLGVRGKPVCNARIDLPGQWVGIDRIYKKAQAMNMDVRGITIVGAYYEVHAVNSNNQRILAYFSPRDGKLVSTRAYSPWRKSRNKTVSIPGVS
jgi:hypothetical protein